MIFIVASDSIVPAETVKSLVVVLLPIFKVPAEMISLALSKSKPVPSTSVLPPVCVNVPLSFFDVLSNVKLPLEILMLPFQVPVEPTSTLPPLTFNVEFFEIVISVSFEIAPFETFMVEDAVPLPIVKLPPEM